MSDEQFSSNMSVHSERAVPMVEPHRWLAFACEMRRHEGFSFAWDVPNRDADGRLLSSTADCEGVPVLASNGAGSSEEESSDTDASGSDEGSAAEQRSRFRGVDPKWKWKKGKKGKPAIRECQAGWEARMPGTGALIGTFGVGMAGEIAAARCYARYAPACQHDGRHPTPCDDGAAVSMQSWQGIQCYTSDGDLVPAPAESKYKGVSWDRVQMKWKAEHRPSQWDRGRTRCLGHFDTELLANQALKDGISKLAEFLRQNHRPEGYTTAEIRRAGYTTAGLHHRRDQARGLSTVFEYISGTVWAGAVSSCRGPG